MYAIRSYYGDLEQMVRSGRMREDFYYRINTVPILMPPLQDRKEDLPLLIDYFVNTFADGTHRDITLPTDSYNFV